MAAKKSPLRVVSWNVNGIRAVAKKGFREWLDSSGAHVVGLQEVRATPEQFPDELRELKDWHVHVVPAQRPGYSGVAIFSREKPDDVVVTLGHEEIDGEGRLQISKFGALTVVNGYFPNGNGKERDNSRIPFKLDFYKRLFKRLDKERKAGGRILVMGDFNTAHREIDLARPKENAKTSGFMPIERDELDRWIKAGWIDTFREFQQGPDHYSWWSQRFGVREKNIGWRLDMVLASAGARPFVKDAFIHPHVKGSDHCPVGVDLDPAVVK